MKLEAAQRQIVARVIAEAHDSCDGVTADVKRAIAEGLADLERFGHAWVSDLLTDLVAAGCGSLYADWRRSLGIDAKTKKGTAVAMHGFGAVRETSESGEVFYRQMRFEDMDLDQLRNHRAALAANRDTLSRQITLTDDLIAVMEADPSVQRAGDALARLAAAA